MGHWITFLLGATIASSVGAEPRPVMTTAGKTLVTETFSASELPKDWTAAGEPDSFHIVDGALQGVCKPGGSHDPFVIVKLASHDISVQFRARFVEAGVLLLLIDGHSDMFNKNTHLARLTMKPKEVSIQQDLGSPESKQTQKETNAKLRKEGGKPPAPTPEQLKDPRFYHSEQLALKRIDIGVGPWHDVLLEINGSQMVAQVDGAVALVADSVAVDAMKSRMVFEVGGRGTVQIDDVKVTENTLRPDWKSTTKPAATMPAK